MLIKAKQGNKILFCGHISPTAAIQKYGNTCDLYYLVNELADPTLKTETGAISVRDDNFGKASWLFLEFDRELPEFKCHPSKIVQSSKGKYHVYWRVPELEKLGLDQVKQYFRALSQHYQTDLTKPLQMLRLPGSLNHKYNPPQEVKLIYDSPAAYTLAELFDGITVEEAPHVKRQKSNPFQDYLVNTYLKNKLETQFAFPEKNHNNNLNRAAYVLIQDWANLAGRAELLDLLYEWAVSNSHLPTNEIRTTLKKFEDESRYPSRWFFENNSEPDFEYKRSLNHFYKSLLSDLATTTTPDGKTKTDSLAQASARNWFLSRLLANLGYSPRCNYYLDKTGRQIEPFRVATALEGWVISSAIKEERRIYGQLETSPIEPVNEYFKALPSMAKSTAEDVLKELFLKIMNLSQIDYVQARKWLILAAKRARWGIEEPVINPYCLLLAGQQGVGKSAFFEILGGNWNYSYTQDTESTLAMLGSLTVTLDEYDRFTNKGQSEIKNLISDPTDKVRQKYARSAIALNRLFSFGGTTNSSEFLKDPTGSRRFLVVSLPQGYRQPYNLNWLKENRDRIWAAALALAPDEPIEFSPEEIAIIEGAKEQFDSRTHQEELLREWVDGNCDETIPYRDSTPYSYSEIAEIVSPNGKLTPGEKSHLTDLLLKLGWRKGSGYRDGKKHNWMISPARSTKVAQPSTLAESIL